MIGSVAKFSQVELDQFRFGLVYIKEREVPQGYSLIHKGLCFAIILGPTFFRQIQEAIFGGPLVDNDVNLYLVYPSWDVEMRKL